MAPLPFLFFSFLCGKGAVFFNRNLPHVSMRGERGHPTGVKKRFFLPTHFLTPGWAQPTPGVFLREKYKVFSARDDGWKKNWATTNEFPVGGKCSKKFSLGRGRWWYYGYANFSFPKKMSSLGDFFKKAGVVSNRASSSSSFEREAPKPTRQQNRTLVSFSSFHRKKAVPLMSFVWGRRRDSQHKKCPFLLGREGREACV